MLRSLIMVIVCFAVPIIAADAAEDQELKPGTAFVHLQGGYSLRPVMSLFQQPMPTRAEGEQALRDAFATKHKTVVIDCSAGSLRLSAACAESFAHIIRHQRLKKQQVICLLDDVGDVELIIAAACDEVVCNQAGFNNIDGVAMYLDYYTDALAKCGIRFHAVTSGPQKTAPEFITRSQPSPAAIAEAEKIMTAIDDNLITQSQRDAVDGAAIKAARAVAPQTSKQMIDMGLADKAVELGAWYEGLERPITQPGKKNNAPDLSSFTGMMQFWGQLMRGPQDTKPKAFIAVVELEGSIVDGAGSEPGLIADRPIVHLLKDLREDERVKGILIRMNSPGGSATASDRIYHAIKKAAAEKPCITLIDDVAASGGYYIAAATPYIMAHQSSVTGSIGVFSMMPDLSAMRRELGIHRHVLRSSPRATLMDSGQFDESKRQALAELINDIDQRFKGIVAESRDLEMAAVDALADGKVYLAAEALGKDLIDATGTYADAIAYLQQKLQDQSLPTERYPAPQGLAQLLGLETMLGLPPAIRLLIQEAGSMRVKAYCWKPLPVLQE